jgi:very-short-patch-repair endonuclease
VLWELLRDRRLSGAKFRRQHPIGPFVADFFCADARLVVEADGAPHRHQRQRDAARDLWLESLGLTVLRFFNRDILEHMDEVLRRIRAELVTSRRMPNPRPQR